MRRALLVSGVVLACATAATMVGTAPTGDEILFPHARHKQADVDCITCHEAVYDAKDLNGEFLPKEAKCLECHKQKKVDGQCNFCHLDVQHAATWPKREPRLKLDHAAHIERVKEDCTQCHTRLSEPRHPAPITDGHAACLKCHEHAQQHANAQCATCHVDLAQWAMLPTSQMSHQGDFLRRHANVARADTQSCNLCHDANFCLDCHAKTTMVPIETKLVDRPDRRFIHRADFIGRHMVEARADPASCQKCHSTTSCETCHEHERVAAGWSPKSPHPPGWGFPGSGSFHGDAARRNIASCASCHDQGDNSNCVSCHKVGGIGGDPHPAGWGSHHTIADAASDGRCIACHR